MSIAGLTTPQEALAFVTGFYPEAKVTQKVLGRVVS